MRELPAVCACPSSSGQQSARSRQACASRPWHLSVWGTLLLSTVASRPFPGITSATVLLQASLGFTQELGACRLCPAGPGEAGLPAGRVTLGDQGRRALREVLMGTRGILCTRRGDGGCATARPRPARVPTMGHHATAPSTSTATWLCSGHPSTSQQQRPSVLTAGSACMNRGQTRRGPGVLGSGIQSFKRAWTPRATRQVGPARHCSLHERLDR